MSRNAVSRRRERDRARSIRNKAAPASGILTDVDHVNEAPVSSSTHDRDDDRVGPRLHVSTELRNGVPLVVEDLEEDLDKSRRMACPRGLVPKQIFNKNGDQMSVCVREVDPAISSDPFYHASRDITGMRYGVRRLDGSVIATWNIPGKTSRGKKLAIAHPMFHFGDDVHAVRLHPESHEPAHPDAAGPRHNPLEAYHHAVGKLIIRGHDGAPYGVLTPLDADAEGNVTLYNLLRRPEHQYYRRGANNRTSEPGTPDWEHRGSGIAVTPEQVEFLHRHPPTSGVERGPSGHPFVTWTRIAVPAVDAERRPIPGRPLHVRYEVKLDPSVYGDQYDALRKPHVRKYEGDEPIIEQRFRRFVEHARRRLFPREADRRPSAEVKALLQAHGGDIAKLIESGDLGHQNVTRQGAGGFGDRKQRTVEARKPISERDALVLGARWKAQNPAHIDALRTYARMRFPGTADDAAIDDAIDAGLTHAIHRFDPSLGIPFVRYARQTANGFIQRIGHDQGQMHGAERFAAFGEAAGASAEDLLIEREEEQERKQKQRPGRAETPPRQGAPSGLRSTPTAATATSRISSKDAAYREDHGSQEEFGRVLEQVFPEDERTRRVMAALYPTGDFGRGGDYRRARELTGVPYEELRTFSAPAERVKAHRAYQRYKDHWLRDAEERRAALERSQSRVARKGELVQKTLDAIGDELGLLALARRVRE